MTNRIVITIEGGVIQAVGADDRDIEVVVLDFDLEDEEHPEAKCIDGELCQYIVPGISRLSPAEERWLTQPFINEI